MTRSNTRPFYTRLLRLRHLRPRPWVMFLLLEGSMAVAALLALAEVIHWLGVLIVPATIALVMKLHDAIAGAYVRPVASAQLRSPGVLPQVVRGVAPIPETPIPETPILGVPSPEAPVPEPPPDQRTGSSALDLASPSHPRGGPPAPEKHEAPVEGVRPDYQVRPSRPASSDPLVGRRWISMRWQRIR